MDPYVFEDALTGSTIACEYPGLRTAVVSIGDDGRAGGTRDLPDCTSLFFPGCSLLNYGLPLVKAVQDLLQQAGCIDGVSLLCCGKILSYEPEGDVVRASFEDQLRNRLAETSITRIVAACPNCVKALRSALEADDRTAHIQVAVLPQVLADLGYRIDQDQAQRLIAADIAARTGASDNPDPASIKVCPHDSCPDRDTGEFADGLRTLLPADMIVEAQHNRRKSFCCGSLLRAVGKVDAADRQAVRHGEEALDAQASAIVTACVSCSFQLSTAQKSVPVFHYLELLFNWRINWPYVDQYMKLRFLFDDSLGVSQDSEGGRPFVGIG